MNTPPVPPNRMRTWLMMALVLVLGFDLAFAWQRHAGAYSSEFGGHPDEAAHYVTGLMIRDYIAKGMPGNPMTFAQEYYRHYPKIALGIWPPVFYLVQSAWTLPFGVSRTSMLLLICVLAAILATMLFCSLREEVGGVPAALGGALLLSLPLVRENYSMVMAEMLSAVFMFGAAYAFGRFLEEEKRSHVLWFGLLSALAILTKGTGVALALMAGLALLISGKWALLRRPALWGAAVLTVVLAGPWTWHFRNEGRLHGAWMEPSTSLHYISLALPYFGGKLFFSLGLVVVAFMLVGMWVKLAGPGARKGRWAAFAALIVGVFVFHVLTPVALEARYLIPVLPAGVAFAVAGMGALVARLGGRVSEGVKAWAPAAATALLLGASVGWFTLYPPRWRAKQWTGFRPLAQLICRDHAPGTATVLVSSDASGEGMFISELAMADERPGHVVERASKVLASMQWTGREYRPRFASDEALLEYLGSGAFGYVALDDSISGFKRQAHHEMLERVLTGNPARFAEVASAPMVRDSILQAAPARLFRVMLPAKVTGAP